MVDIGRVVIKLTGREAGKRAVIVEVVDDNFVIIDGDVKRRRCNCDHLALLPEKLEIEEGAGTEKVKSVFKEKGWLTESKSKVANKRERKGGVKPKKKKHKKGQKAKPKKETAPDKGKTKPKKAKKEKKAEEKTVTEKAPAEADKS